MRDLESVFINFGHLGWPDFLPVTHVEMRALLAAAEHLVATYQPEVIELMLQEVESDLLLHATTEPEVNSQWISWATLTTAIRGLQGQELPAVLHQD